MEQDELKVSQEEVKVGPDSLEESTTSNKVWTFKELLEAKEIKIEDRISFTVFGSDKETIVTVDQAFLDLPIMEETYYEQFNYKKYES